jgi:hypothetical protein
MEHLNSDTPVGYIEAEDVYVVYSEYYGGDTIYGRKTLLMPDGSPVKGAGKTKGDLLVLGVLVVQEETGATHGFLTPVPFIPLEPTPEVTETVTEAVVETVTEAVAEVELARPLEEAVHQPTLEDRVSALESLVKTLINQLRSVGV